jgi:antirestriction protein
MMSTTTERRIYVASLADYNNGRLHGVWIDATQGADAIEEQTRAMLRQSKYPNVVLPCPEGCDPSHVTAWVAGEGPLCETCAGRGTVPSAEEWAIHDFEGFEGIKLSEWESFVTVAALAELLEEHGEAFAAWYDNDHRDERERDEWGEQFAEQYAGTARTLEEWCEDAADSWGLLEDLPENLRRFFDFEKYAREMQMGGDIWTAEGGDGVHVFWNR